ncbi:hypothetical protein [Streptomyces sp. SM11]|uniref:hypothetical protein n=1 Tax=Streptomyces sp. SM11 TaxID=565557 RepID=UPI0011B0EEA4|nr:hypothetical protein [Streptomyces sp. SM11]
MTEPTNQQIAKDVAAIEKALEGKADKESVEGLVRRSEVRPKALVDGPGETEQSGSPATAPENSDQQDLATQKELQDATASSVWTNVKPAELVGFALAWQALKFELPTLFNLEIFTEKLLGKMNLFPNAEGNGLRIARNEYGFLLPTRRPAAGEPGEDGADADPAPPGTQPTPAGPASPTGPPAPRGQQNRPPSPEPGPRPGRSTPRRSAQGRSAPGQTPGGDPEQQRRLQASLRRTNDESRRAATALRDASDAASDLARSV